MIEYLYSGDYDVRSMTQASFAGISASMTKDIAKPIEDGQTARLEDPDKAPADLPPDYPEVEDNDAHRMSGQDEERTYRRKPKKGKKKTGSAAHIARCAVLQDESRTISISETNPLTIHAKVYAAAAKYHIAPLVDLALKKFELESQGHWEVEDIVAAVPVVYARTPENETSMRTALQRVILENADRLVSSPEFGEAVEKIDGLAFELFKKLSPIAPYQVVCKMCCTAFLSKCRVNGCKATGFGGYHSAHSCDYNGPCWDCKSRDSVL